MIYMIAAAVYVYQTIINIKLIRFSGDCISSLATIGLHSIKSGKLIDLVSGQSQNLALR